LISIIYLIFSRYYKKLGIIAFYSFGFAILNCGIESFLFDYTDSNRIDETFLYSIRFLQLILAILCIFLPLFFLKPTKKPV
jgi:hypothetical protein